MLTKKEDKEKKMFVVLYVTILAMFPSLCLLMEEYSHLFLWGEVY